jgi:DNA topoisomerase VI subunit B
MDEIKFAVMEAARGIQRYLSGKRRESEIAGKRKLVLRYVEQLSSDLATLSGKKQDGIQTKLTGIIDKKYVASKEEEAGNVEHDDNGKDKKNEEPANGETEEGGE